MSNILDHPLISERYFFPRVGYFKDPFWVDCGDAQLACSYHEIDPYEGGQALFPYSQLNF